MQREKERFLSGLDTSYTRCFIREYQWVPRIVVLKPCDSLHIVFIIFLNPIILFPLYDQLFDEVVIFYLMRS